MGFFIGKCSVNNKTIYINDTNSNAYTSLADLIQKMSANQEAVLTMWYPYSDFPDAGNAFYNIRITRGHQIGYTRLEASVHNNNNTIIRKWYGTYGQTPQTVTWHEYADNNDMIITTYLGVKAASGRSLMRVVIKQFTFSNGYTDTLNQSDLDLVGAPYDHVAIMCKPFLDTTDNYTVVIVGFDSATMRFSALKPGNKTYSGTVWLTYLATAFNDE